MLKIVIFNVKDSLYLMLKIVIFNVKNSDI